MSTRSRRKGQDNAAALAQLASLITAGKRVVFMTGAGMSAGSGVPTFRGADGLWATYIMEWGTRAAFLRDPVEWYNQFWLRSHERALEGKPVPNLGHEGLSAIMAAHPQCRIITQNVDHLHHDSGAPVERTVECHGRWGLWKCVRTPECRYAKNESISGLSYAYGDGGAGGAGGAGGVRGAGLAEAAGGAGRVTGAVDGSDGSGVARKKAKKSTKGSPRGKRKRSRSGDAGTAAEAAAGGKRIVDSPRCPECGEPVLPQCLFFDEQYDSHTFYRWDEAVDWMDSAEAFVFVGTSLADILVTELALGHVAARRVPAFIFNLQRSDRLEPDRRTGKIVSPLEGDGSRLVGAALDPACIMHVLGKSEVTLPQLCALVGGGDVQGSAAGSGEGGGSGGGVLVGGGSGSSGGEGGKGGGGGEGGAVGCGRSEESGEGGGFVAGSEGGEGGGSVVGGAVGATSST
jgi:NAD-dependent SIR2 family protein deacetylase